jgi:hypothetical protein
MDKAELDRGYDGLGAIFHIEAHQDDAYVALRVASAIPSPAAISWLLLPPAMSVRTSRSR